jgi:hypothetical protein
MMLIEYKMGWALTWLYGEGATSIVLMFVVGYCCISDVEQDLNPGNRPEHLILRITLSRYDSDNALRSATGISGSHL